LVYEIISIWRLTIQSSLSHPQSTLELQSFTTTYVVFLFATKYLKCKNSDITSGDMSFRKSQALLLRFVGNLCNSSLKALKKFSDLSGDISPIICLLAFNEIKSIWTKIRLT
jgi:hypothetical protein